MPELEILELIALIVVLIPLSFSYYILKRRKDMYPLLPGALCLVLSFLFTNLEAVAAPEVFNFMEHFFLMLAGVLLALAMIVMYNKQSPEKPQTQQLPQQLPQQLQGRVVK